jgi:hypothetical protein
MNIIYTNKNNEELQSDRAALLILVREGRKAGMPVSVTNKRTRSIAQIEAVLATRGITFTN